MNHLDSASALRHAEKPGDTLSGYRIHVTETRVEGYITDGGVEVLAVKFSQVDGGWEVKKFNSLRGKGTDDCRLAARCLIACSEKVDEIQAALEQTSKSQLLQRIRDGAYLIEVGGRWMLQPGLDVRSKTLGSEFRPEEVPSILVDMLVDSGDVDIESSSGYGTRILSRRVILAGSRL